MSLSIKCACTNLSSVCERQLFRYSMFSHTLSSRYCVLMLRFTFLKVGWLSCVLIASMEEWLSVYMVTSLLSVGTAHRAYQMACSSASMEQPHFLRGTFMDLFSWGAFSFGMSTA